MREQLATRRQFAAGASIPGVLSNAVFSAQPVIAEVFDTWSVTYGPGTVTLNGAPSVTTPQVTFGSTQLIVTG